MSCIIIHITVIVFLPIHIYDMQLKHVSVEVIGSKGGGIVDSAEIKSDRPGFIAMGTGGYYAAQFDNFSIIDAS